MTDYSERLRDPRWQKRRLEILQRDSFTCTSCSDTEMELHVHHRYYDEGKDPWDYPSEALVTLCKDCHEYERREWKKNLDILGWVLARAGFISDDLIYLAEFIHNGDLAIFEIMKNLRQIQVQP